MTKEIIDIDEINEQYIVNLSRMVIAIKEELKCAVEHFKQWMSSSHSPHKINGGKMDENAYPEWGKIEDLCEKVFVEEVFSQLDLNDKKRIIFIIGRQWDLGRILNWFNKGSEEIGQLGMTKEQLMELSIIAVEEDDVDAKGQLAASLFKVGSVPEVEELLLKFHKDSDEYVRRQALCSLEKVGYSKMEDVLIESWEYNQEFERILCLNMLADKGHEKFDSYLEEALSDNREHIRETAIELKKNR